MAEQNVWPTVHDYVVALETKLKRCNRAVHCFRAALAESQERLSAALTEQRRELGAMHDETILELNRVRKVAKEEIERLEQELAEARLEIRACSCVCHVEAREVASERAERDKCPKCK